MFLINQKLLVIAFLIATLISCSNKRLKIVDEENNPIKNAMVISGKRPFLMGAQERMICLSSDYGEVNVVPRYKDLVIYKPGYYPLFNDSRTPGAPEWSKLPISHIIKMYKIRHSDLVNKLEVESTLSVGANLIGNKAYIEHLFLKDKVSVLYEKSRHSFSFLPKNDWKVYAANQFFFDDSIPNLSGDVTAHIDDRRRAIFYISNSADRRIYKVLIAYTGGVSGYAMSPYWTFDFKVASVADLGQPVYPSINKWVKDIHFVRNGYSKEIKPVACNKNYHSINEKLLEYYNIEIDQF